VSARISAIGHTEDYSPLTIENGRHFMANRGTLENDECIRGRMNINFARARARLEYRMAQAVVGMSVVDNRYKQREVPAAIEVVVEMPANVITGTVVNSDLLT
jgi:hypothetical protein